MSALLSLIEVFGCIMSSTARRQGDRGSHQAYGRATSPYNNESSKEKNAASVRLGQFSDYLSKNSYIFVLKLRFGKRVTDVSPIGDDDIMLTILDQTRKSTNDYS